MKQKPKSISWKVKQVDDVNLDWYEEGVDIINNKLMYKFYLNKKDDLIYLIDVIDGVTYKLPKDQKTKGYVLAFKLMTSDDFPF